MPSAKPNETLLPPPQEKMDPIEAPGLELKNDSEEAAAEVVGIEKEDNFANQKVKRRRVRRKKNTSANGRADEI